jgi:hypothetical protein
VLDSKAHFHHHVDYLYSEALNLLGLCMYVVFTAVTMRNAVVLDVTSCGSCKNETFRRNLSSPSSG